MITRGERRRLTNRIIRKRKIKILSILYKPSLLRKNPFESGDAYEGELRNNNIMNRYGFGFRRKTKTRRACAAYRHHGSFGPAKRYTSHDRRQVDDGNQQIQEYNEEIKWK